MYLSRKQNLSLEDLIDVSREVRESNQRILCIDFVDKPLFCDGSPPKEILDLTDFDFDFTSLDSQVKKLVSSLDSQLKQKNEFFDLRPIQIIPFGVLSVLRKCPSGMKLDRFIGDFFENLYLMAFGNSLKLYNKRGSSFLDLDHAPLRKRNITLMCLDEVQDLQQHYSKHKQPFQEISIYSAIHKHCDCFSKAYCHVDEETRKYRMLELMSHAYQSHCHSIEFIFS